MKKLIKMIVIVNLIAMIVVAVLSQYVSAFKTTSLSDFLFYIVIVVWAISGLTRNGGREGRTWSDESVSTRSSSKVEGHDFDSEQHVQNHYNFQFAFMMFIAGLPALLGCFILRWLS